MTDPDDLGARVRLSVTQVNINDIPQPGQLLLDLHEDTQTAIERAKAWAQVRGYDRLMSSIDDMNLGGEPPKSGFRGPINSPHGLLIVVTWPWAPAGHFTR